MPDTTRDLVHEFKDLPALGVINVKETIEYNGETYLAVTLATDEEDVELEVSILKSVEEDDGESTLCAIEDEEELQTVYQQIMDSLYEEDEE